ncbi:hypothetical protein IQ227_07285 [Anabaena aphanizomenioides LEGE 00250]|uniref:Uncharacterized protein n=1 Tax=Sphaerospermopsis aphanizomenoides LEGE 00250 TaxID=2777972 RepID=A0ABR9VBG9_9CYAN|nr:hypothetical protein [Sphaerospermopsis aphanizomenoides]MBE9235844.1 hypothetical protein [Sphaerospermopsis aphanizomenoides LEGE 00250]
MDFRIINSTFGYSEHIDEKARQWGGVEENILNYLCDVSNLEKFADMANDSDQLASYIDPFLTNAEKYFEAMEKMSDGQVKWTELRKKFSQKVADSIAKIRKYDSEFGFEMERIDAQDKSDRTRLEAKRKNVLAEIATTLQHDLQLELFRHQNKIADITSRQSVQQERQAIQQSVREKRQSLMERVKRGSRGGNPPEEKINVG